MRSILSGLKLNTKIITVGITEKERLQISTCSKHRLFSENYHLEEMTKKILIATCVNGFNIY